MMTCKEVAEKLSSGVSLSFAQKAELTLHLLMCKNCQVYRKHLLIIADALKNLAKSRTVDEKTIEGLETQLIKKYCS